MNSWPISFAKRCLLPAFLLLAATCLAQASAPDSVSDSLYVETFRVVSTRLNNSRSVRLFADGTYRENWVVNGSAITLSVYGYAGDYGTPTRGSYTYTKTSDSTATLVFSPAGGGTATSLDLTFTASDEGTFSYAAAGNFRILSNRTTKRPLANISSRLHVHGGEVSIVGFVVDREGDFLVRAIGPGLTQFGLTNFWANPSYQIYSNGNRLHPWGTFTGSATAMVNPPTWDWNQSYSTMHSWAFAATGEFALNSGSKDVATVIHLSEGAYTIVAIPDAADPGGDVLLEVTEIP